MPDSLNFEILEEQLRERLSNKIKVIDVMIRTVSGGYTSIEDIYKGNNISIIKNKEYVEVFYENESGKHHRLYPWNRVYEIIERS